jgi:hypothetical protein
LIRNIVSMRDARKISPTLAFALAPNDEIRGYLLTGVVVVFLLVGGIGGNPVVSGSSCASSSGPAHDV